MSDLPTDRLEEAMARALLRRQRGKPIYVAPTIGRISTRLLSKYLKNEGTGPGIGPLQRNWPQIAGDRLAKVSIPEKISGPKGNQTLALRVLPAAATLVQHQSEDLRQKIATATGGQVSKLKITQGPLEMRGPNSISPSKKKRLSELDKQELSAKTAKVEDTALKKALLAFGEAVYKGK